MCNACKKGDGNETTVARAGYALSMRYHSNFSSDRVDVCSRCAIRPSVKTSPAAFIFVCIVHVCIILFHSSKLGEFTDWLLVLFKFDACRFFDLKT